MFHTFDGSSHVRDLEYDPQTKTASVRFKNSDRIYRHSGVPQSAIDNWLKDVSPGKFFHQVIKRHYPQSREKD